MPQNKKNLLLLLLIIILAVIVYLPSLSAPFVFDDISGIVNNQNLKNIYEIGRIWNISFTRFISNLTFTLNYHFSGHNVLPYHIVNLSIHLLTSFVLYLFVFKITSNRILSLIAGLIFSLHPVQTQAVTYIVQRSASLAALFYISSLYLYLKSSDRKIYLAASIVSAILAFFTKEISFTLPIAILLTDIFFIKRDKSKSKIRFLYFGIFLSLLIFAIGIQTGLIFSPRDSFKVIASTTGQHSSAISRSEYFISQISVIGIYLKLLIFPVNQNFDYDLPQKISLYRPDTLVSLTIISLLFLFAFLNKNKLPLISYSVLLFFLALSVESSVFPIEDLAFEYRLYLPMIGFSIFTAFFLTRLINIKKFQSVSKIILVLLITALSILTYERNSVYKSEISLWQDTAKKSPKKPRVIMALAASYNKEGMLDDAILEYQKAIALDPKKQNLALNNLGLIYLHKKDEKKAEEYFKLSINKDPKDTIARNNLANLLYSQGNKDEALSEYQNILTIDPENKEALRSLGYINLNSSKPDEAISKFEEIVALPIRSDISLTELGDAYRSTGNLTEAVSSYQKALKLNTRNENAYIGLGKTHLLLKKPNEAKIAFQKALKLNPKNIDAQTGIKILEGITDN